MKHPRAGADRAGIASRLARAALGLSPAQSDAVAEFLELLVKWNRVHNLTGITDVETLVSRHVGESLALREYLGGDRIADVGSGAGLPGLPLAIAEPGRSFTLIESRAKRARFLRHAAGALALGNVSVEEMRAEDLPIPPAFDTVLARAVAPPAEVVAIGRRLLGSSGRLLVLTSAARTGEYVRLAPDFAARLPRRDPDLASSIVVLERS